MHGIEKTNIGLPSTLSLLKFLRFEGKADLDGNGKPISTFEYDLYNRIHAKLEEADLSMRQKTLTGLVLIETDSYDDRYLKVNLKSVISPYLRFRMYC